jgi:hypothetical protein
VFTCSLHAQTFRSEGSQRPSTDFRGRRGDGDLPRSPRTCRRPRRHRPDLVFLGGADLRRSAGRLKLDRRLRSRDPWSSTLPRTRPARHRRDERRLRRGRRGDRHHPRQHDARNPSQSRIE